VPHLYNEEVRDLYRSPSTVLTVKLKALLGAVDVARMWRQGIIKIFVKNYLCKRQLAVM